MVRAKRYWLMKSEPDTYSIDDLERDGVTPWEGVRNYQARNLLRDEVQVGDEVLFYHSNAKPPGVAGLGRVIRAAYPDPSAFDSSSEYHDPRSSSESPTWIAVDVRFVRKLERLVTLDELKANPELEGMLVTRRGQRLSVQPLSAEHFRTVVAMAAHEG